MPPANRGSKIARKMVKAAIVLYVLQLVFALVLHVKSYRHDEVDGISITREMATRWYESIIPGIGLILDMGEFMPSRSTRVTFEYGGWSYAVDSDDVGSIDWEHGLHTRQTDDWIRLYAAGREWPVISMPREGARIDL